MPPVRYLQIKFWGWKLDIWSICRPGNGMSQPSSSHDILCRQWWWGDQKRPSCLCRPSDRELPFPLSRPIGFLPELASAGPSERLPHPQPIRTEVLPPWQVSSDAKRRDGGGGREGGNSGKWTQVPGIEQRRRWRYVSSDARSWAEDEEEKMHAKGSRPHLLSDCQLYAQGWCFSRLQ